MNKLLIAACAMLSMASCVSTKPYERVKLSDPDMALADIKCDRNLLTAHSYREAASGGNGGKTGGGCGCN
jgi:hypothetical protein